LDQMLKPGETKFICVVDFGWNSSSFKSSISPLIVRMFRMKQKIFMEPRLWVTIMKMGPVTDSRFRLSKMMCITWNKIEPSISKTIEIKAYRV
jgi:hypothetical protein